MHQGVIFWVDIVSETFQDASETFQDTSETNQDLDEFNNILKPIW